MKKIDWTKVLLAAAGIIGGWVAPRVYRAIKNLSKNEKKIADEALEDAIKKQETAHANSDPSDDKTSDEAVARAKKHKENIQRLSALTDAIDPDSETDKQ